MPSLFLTLFLRPSLSAFPAHSGVLQITVVRFANLSSAMDPYSKQENHFELTEQPQYDSSSERGLHEYDIQPGTAEDDQDMRRLGKKQQLSRQFHALSIFGLTSVVMFTWQAILSTAIFSLINGGRGGSVYSFLATWILTIPVVASMAEMASMAPTSGGQYHWASSSPLAAVVWLTGS